jgi:hypothetical protein
MKKMWLTATDGVEERREFRWVVWGEPDECFLFDRSYRYRGHAVRRAKKLLDDGHATHACVTKPQNGSFFTVHFGNSLSSFLFQVVEE